MKFLLISEATIDIEQYLKMYMGDYIEHESDVLIRYNIEDAKTVIVRELIENQKHFDFIIADFSTDQFYQDYMVLTQWIREWHYTYSDYNFKLSAIPIFLMNNAMDMARHFYSTLEEQIENIFDGIVYKPDDHKRIGTSNNALAKGIDRWLDKLKSDIDDLDLDANSDFTDLNIRIFNARVYKLRVLASSFIENKKPLDYLWVGNNLQIIESTGDSLIKLLKTYNQNPSLRNEKQIHEFLKKYHHLLKSENFYKSIYEQHFYHQNSMKYEEVDFLNIAHKYSLNKHEFFEVKLPNQRFFSKKNLDVLKPAQKYFHQIGTKYVNYFSNQTNLTEVQVRANTHDVTITNLDFQYSLLMGRDEDKQQNLYGLNAFTSTLKGNVRLLTYDDLLKRHHYLHLRVTRFGI
ncbi:hypothetical protein SAMN05421821_10269 [Mucilaginibacter lappiensis]|uniref:Shedu protein SduA C-terminal domain-containing protein n=1 Tax=Mucilaginibacter lappiensis TaxID=354630 RepID=A0ABR6PGB3_9SPHI|nr:Shedu anti-phage system protein SduA domain-containing protein [Mucilaginibacter lappiensis]MBB6108696.1 hypothetical protein [Mucilaginibacter lappiensis]SIQ27423.1 hypothetical protein SAMN05421821_10269 [Mucilaginibacter lappiensis]